MRVALLTDGIWPFVIGGMQKHSFYICKFLAQSGVNVDLYHTAQDLSKIDLRHCFSENELKFIRSFEVGFPKSDKFPGHYIRASKKYSAALCERLKENDYADLVYAKGLTSWSLLTGLEHKQLKAPVCINVHGYEYYQKSAGFKSRVEQWMIRQPFRIINEKADYIYSYGSGITKLISKHIPGAKRKIIEMPSGVERDVIADSIVNPLQPYKFIFVGRFERRKGIDEINKAIKYFKPEVPFLFHFVGNIPEDSRISDRRAIYHGEIKVKEELINLLNTSDVLVCPSYAEGMPNVIMEGMACGCAVIATPVGSVGDLVHADNGLLIQPGSVKALIRAMHDIIAMSPSKLASMKKRSNKYIRDGFVWEDVIKSLLISFNTIAANNVRQDNVPAVKLK